MTLSDITRVGVLGAGQMGRGIAQVAAASGWDVWLFDSKPEALEAALGRIRQGLHRAVEKGTVRADQMDAILGGLRPMNRLRDFDEVPLIIEAVPENATLKCDLFRQLGLLCRPETVLASNTSSISITKLGAVSGRPAQVLGLHFMNPAPVMRLVEVVQGMETSEETLALGVGVAKQMGKTPVVCKDSPGFIVNRVLIPMINEAIFLLQEGQDGMLTPQAIDLAMTEGYYHPMVLMAFSDMICLGTVLSDCDEHYLHLDCLYLLP